MNLIKHTTFFFLLFIPFIGFTQNGKISGLLIDKASQETLIGVNVSVVNTSQGTISDIDGKYEITDLTPGIYSISFSYIGYVDKMVANVQVRANETTTLNVSMELASNELSEVHIIDFKKTNSETAVLLEMKNANQIASGISSQQIGKTTDRDAAQVVKRIPGVLVSGNFINIRGLNQRYNNVLLHNAIAPSVETDVKSFAFDIIPSSQLDRIIILKSPSADVPGDFAGGMVKIYTKSLPDSNFYQVNYSTTFRTGTTFKPFYRQKVGAATYVGFDNYNRLPKSFPSNVNDVSGDALQEAGRSLNNNWTATKLAAIPDQRIGFTKGTRIQIKKGLIGNITAINYSLTKQTNAIERADFEDYNFTENRPTYRYKFKDMQYNQAIKIGVLHNWAFKLPKIFLEFKNLLNLNASTQYVHRTGQDFSNGINADNGSFNQLYKGIYSTQVTAKQDIKNDISYIDWMVGYNYSYRNQPDYRIYAQDVDTATGKKSLRIQTGSATPEILGRFFSTMKENNASASAAYTHKLVAPKHNIVSTLSVGVFTDYKTRAFRARNMGFIVSNISLFDVSLRDKTIQELFQPQNINNTTGIKLDEQTNKSDSYTAENIQAAAFTHYELAYNNKLRMDIGLRYEYNQQKLNSYTFTNDPISVKKPQHLILPSVNIGYNITPKMIIRAAYGMSTNRPEFREIAPFGYYDFNISYVIKGNPNLKNCTIHNVDLKWEYYPSAGEVLNVSTFYKHFNNPIEMFTRDLGNRTFSFQNAKRADVYGVEIEIRKNFTRATNFLKDFGIVANASYIYSRVHLDSIQAIGQSNNRPLQGQSPYVVNAGIFYNNKDKRVQFNIMYNVIGKRIIYVGAQHYPDIYELPRHTLDFNISYLFKKGVEISFAAQDLINQKSILVQDGNNDGKIDKKNDQIFQQYKPGTQFSFGVKYTFK
ncbi:MAG TPA: TonB-dependent receptor [Chitinophagales bacterium]|nr:TonB-dependent receptor [Chitinophagales bacterium]HNM31334.1 TonB-dependent receptor [Chitinophagales bacterium]